jgi:hypothetical protein
LILALFSGALSAYILAYIFLKALGFSPNPRTDIQSHYDFINTVDWLLTRLFPQTFRPFFVSSPSEMIAAVQVLLFLVLLTTLLKKIYSFRLILLTYTKVFLSLLILHLPLILTGYTQIEPRFFVGSSIVVVGLLVFLIMEFLRLHKSQICRLNTRSKYFAVITLFSFSVSYNTFFYFKNIYPIYLSTSSFLKSQISTCTEVDKIVIEERTDAWPMKPRIGMFSQVTDLSSAWVPVSAVKVLTQAFFPQIGQPIVYMNSKAGDSSRSCVIKLNDFKVLN